MSETDTKLEELIDQVLLLANAVKELREDVEQLKWRVEKLEGSND